MRTLTLLKLGLVSFLMSNLAVASDSVSIEPGMWEITTTMNSSMSPQPRIQTSQECIKDAQISPEDLAPSDDDSCSMSDVKVSGNSLSWSMLCNTPGGAMKGNGNFTSEGNSGSGKMQMSMNIEGQSFDMEMVWKGHRTGSC
jgi:hypothetical protein